LNSTAPIDLTSRSQGEELMAGKGRGNFWIWDEAGGTELERSRGRGRRMDERGKEEGTG